MATNERQSALHKECEINRRDLGRRLKTARELAGLSHLQAARRMGLMGTTLLRYESEGPNLLSSDLAPWAELYGVRLEWLRGDVEPVSPGLAELANRLTLASLTSQAQMVQQLLAILGPCDPVVCLCGSGGSTTAGNGSA